MSKRRSPADAELELSLASMMSLLGGFVSGDGELSEVKRDWLKRFSGPQERKAMERLCE
jgi:hypothetical protein